MVEDLSDTPAGELTLTEALLHVPGFSLQHPAVQVSGLPGGSLNRSYSVSTPAGRFVLRLSRGPDAWLTTDRSVELRLHAAASEAGIAPRIVESRDQWLITEYVPGRLWTEPDFGAAARLASLARTLAKLHRLPAPDYGRFDLLGTLSDYAERVGESGGLVDFAAAAWESSGGAGRTPAILHHDLHGSNIIEGPRGLVLVDWECAAVSDPLLDVACILSYHESAGPHAAVLLEHCGLPEVTPRQLAACVWLFDLHTYLWYRERQSRMAPTQTEREAEKRLAARLPRTLREWHPGAYGKVLTGASGVESAN